MRALRSLALLLAFSLLVTGCGLFRSTPDQPSDLGGDGSIDLSLIDRSTLRPAPSDLYWNVRTHPSHPAGEQVVYDGNSASPQLQLASGWYLVAVRHDHGITTHVFEIYPGIHQDLSLVRMER